VIRLPAWTFLGSPAAGVARGRDPSSPVFTEDGDAPPPAKLSATRAHARERDRPVGRGALGCAPARGCERIHDQRLPGRPREFLDTGIRGLRDARDDVEARVRSGGTRTARTGDRERRPSRPSATRCEVVLRDEGARRNTLRPAELVRPGPPPRLPLRAPTMGKPTRWPTSPDQERTSEPRMPAAGLRPSSGMAPSPKL
jgi:hypothetical protein